IPWGFINLFLGHDQYTLAWNGFVIMLILLMIFFQSFSKTREEIDTVNSPITYSLIGFACFFFIVIFFFSMSAYRALIAGENRETLASDTSIFSFPFVFTEENLVQAKGELIKNISVNNNSFEGASPITLTKSAPFARSMPFVWYFYSYGAPEAMRASLTAGTSTQGTKALKLEVLGAGAKGQINMGQLPLFNYIPVQERSLYLLKADVNASGSGAVLSVRFADRQGRIIPGSDQVISSVGRTFGWQQISGEFIPEKGHKYAE